MTDVRERIAQVKLFLADVHQEVRRVTWPTTKEIVGATMVVVVATAVLAALLAIIDFVISRLLGVVLQ